MSNEPAPTGSFIVSDASPADGEPMREIAIETRIDAWTVADYVDEIGRDDSIALIASAGRRMAGFLVSRVVPGVEREPDAELYNIAVSPEFQQRGCGDLLLSKLIEKLAAKGVNFLWLEVRESNFAAISFYKKHGFQAEVTRRNFYSDPQENAVIMRLDVPRPGAARS